MLVLGLILLLVGLLLAYVGPAEGRGLGKVLAIIGGVLIAVDVLLAVVDSGELDVDDDGRRGD